MIKDYFFGDRQNKGPWCRARGWGEDGHPLYLPTDVYRTASKSVGGICYSLYRSISQRRWFVIYYNESHSEWHGFGLREETDTGHRLIRSKKAALVEFDKYLAEREKYLKMDEAYYKYAFPMIG